MELLTYTLSGILMGTLAMWVMGAEEDEDADLTWENPDGLLPPPMEE